MKLKNQINRRNLHCAFRMKNNFSEFYLIIEFLSTYYKRNIIRKLSYLKLSYLNTKRNHHFPFSLFFYFAYFVHTELISHRLE